MKVIIAGLISILLLLAAVLTFQDRQKETQVKSPSNTMSTKVTQPTELPDKIELPKGVLSQGNEPKLELVAAMDLVNPPGDLSRLLAAQ